MYQVKTTQSAPSVVFTFPVRSALEPIHFIVMDLIGTFKLSYQGHKNVLTAVDVLTNYTWSTPLFTNEAAEVVHVYLVHMYSKSVGSCMFLSDNDTEFKNKFNYVASTLGMKQVFNSPYYPGGTGYIKNLYNFVKMCI